MAAKRKTTKRKKPAKSAMSVERDIRRAIDTLPELLAEQLALREDETATSAAKQEEAHRIDERAIAQTRHGATRGKRRVLFVGVATLSLLIFGLWYLNTQAYMKKLFQTENVEAVILGLATARIEDALLAAIPSDTDDTAAARKTEEQKQLKERIEYILGGALTLLAANASGTTATATTTE